MNDLLKFGIGLGIALYIGKLGVVWFASRSCRPAQSLFKWMHKTPLALLIFDILINYSASKIITSAPGLTTITALATFQIISIGYCITIYLSHQTMKQVRKYI